MYSVCICGYNTSMALISACFFYVSVVFVYLCIFICEECACVLYIHSQLKAGFGVQKEMKSTQNAIVSINIVAAISFDFTFFTQAF